MKNIIFGITSLDTGGAERTLIDIANSLCDEYNIIIFTVYNSGDLEHVLSPKVQVLSLFKNKYSDYPRWKQVYCSLYLQLFKKSIYHKHIHGYDVEIAFLEGPVTTLFRLRHKNNRDVKKIAWIHTNIAEIFGHGLISSIKKVINKKSYSKYDKLIFVSNNSLESFNKSYKIPVAKKVIHNYINANDIIEKSQEEIDFKFSNNSINFLSVSRFVTAKGIDRLIKVHSKLINDGFAHKIYIIGYGPLENKLKNLIANLNVQNTFILLGKKDNPFPYMKMCDCFLLTSHFEGLPIVLTEAKILNKYILATESASNESLSDYNYKKIVDNSETAIYNGLKELILTGKKTLKAESGSYVCNSKEILNEIKNILEENG